MCRIGSIKSKVPIQPSKALHLMLPQQEGHDNSGFAMVMQDLYGIFSGYKDKPLLSLACTQKGAQLVEDYMDATTLSSWQSGFPFRISVRGWTSRPCLITSSATMTIPKMRSA